MGYQIWNPIKGCHICVGSVSTSDAEDDHANLTQNGRKTPTLTFACHMCYT